MDVGSSCNGPKKKLSKCARTTGILQLVETDRSRQDSSARTVQHRLNQGHTRDRVVHAQYNPVSTKADYDRLRKAHHQMLLRCLGWRKRKRENHILSYANALLRTDSESVETTVRTPRILFAGLLFAGFVARMGEKRLPRRVMLGEMLGGKG